MPNTSTVGWYAFASSEVIPSYREHPSHKRFADEEFRPYAGDRISIDYIAVQADERLTD